MKIIEDATEIRITKGSLVVMAGLQGAGKTFFADKHFDPENIICNDKIFWEQFKKSGKKDMRAQKDYDEIYDMTQELMAQMAKMNLDEFEEYFFNVCNLDYAKMSKAMDNLKELMNRTDKVHIIGEGTDLKFSIKGIPAEKYMGTFNIPDGEVASAPVRDSVNGYITYNTETTYNGITFNNIRFEFENGKIVNATSNNTKELNKILDTDEGARYIGEFAFGLNPYVERPIGDTLFDEKIKGSFHFTPGTALEESDNGNRSSIHWDIVNIQRPDYGGGEIYFDDILIRKDGKFVLKELENLNPENLI